MLCLQYRSLEAVSNENGDYNRFGDKELHVGSTTFNLGEGGSKV